MKIIQIVGYKNSGKTTLISNFIKRLKSQFPNQTVTVIKHHHMADAVYDEHKDTGKFIHSGADISTINTPKLSVEINQFKNSLQDQLKTYEDMNIDICLIEGYKWEDYSKIILTYSYLKGETDIDEIGLTNVLQSFDIRYDEEEALTWLMDWSQKG